jgi:hypothetical protein
MLDGPAQRFSRICWHRIRLALPYYYCVIRIREGSTDNEAAIGPGEFRSCVALSRWIEDYAVLFLRAAPRGV